MVPVRGPDGETAQLIRCGQTEACLEKASEVCPDGYAIRSQGSSVSGVDGNVSSSTEVLVSCKNDMPASPSAMTTAPMSYREDTGTCDAAYAFVDGFAAYWVHASNGRPLDEKTSQRDFVTTCRALPERAQRCVHDKYREAHVQACEAVLTRLDPTSRRQLDALFLEASAPSAAAK